MFLIKLLLKIIVLPAIALLTLVQWFGLFVTSFTEVVLNILAGLFFFTAVAGYIMGICKGAEAGQMLLVGFVVFALPYLAEILIMGVSTINLTLIDFIRS